MTEEINEKGVWKRTFDRVKDDECHNCMYAVRKPEKDTIAPWERLFGCQNVARITQELKFAIKRLNLVLEHMSDKEWEPNLRTATDISDASVWVTEAAKLMSDLYHDGYMKQEIICVYKVGKPETEESK